MRFAKRIPALLLACGMLTGCSEAPAQEETAAIGELRPGDDFYGWCNAEALSARELPEDHQTSGTFADVEGMVDEQIGELISEIAAQNEPFPPGSNEQLVHDLYHLALTDADAAYDEMLIAEIVDYVAEAQSMTELFDIWSDLYYYYGAPVVFTPLVDADLYDHTDYQLWLPPFQGFDGALSTALGDAQTAAFYRDDAALMLMLTGTEEAEAYARADEVMYTLLDIAAAASEPDSSEYSSYWHPFTAYELNARAEHLDYETLLWIMGIGDDPVGKVILEDPEQFFVIDGLLDDDHLQVWKDCTVCAFLQTYRKELPASFDALSNRSEAEPEEFALDETKSLLETEVGVLYAQHYQKPEVCKEVESLCEEIIDSYEEMIRDADWLSGEGREPLIGKLRSMPFCVGAGQPPEIYAEDAALIGRTLLDTAINFKALEPQSIGIWLSQPAETDGYSLLLPQEVNAVYDPRSNQFLITTAVMNPPFFDPDADDIANLGGMGEIIAHEISHAFDSDGIHFNAKGNYDPEWLPEADREAFACRCERTAEYYSRFTVLDTSHVNGTRTLIENLADLGSVQCILNIAGTPERQKQLLEQYSMTEAELASADYIRDRVAEDSHSPASVRVNAVVACFDEFYEIYDVQPGDALYVPPGDRVRRW